VPSSPVHRIAVVPGDGIGVETTREAVRVLEALVREGALLAELTPIPWSAEHTLATGRALPEGAFERLRRDFDAVLVGAFGDPRIPDMSHAKEILLGMRSRLDLFANIRPVKCLDDRLSPLKGDASEIDFLVLRENTEGAYVGMGGRFLADSKDEVAIEGDVTTRVGTERICRYAFERARRFGKPRRLGRPPRVLMADKHNVQRFGGELWRRVFFEVARDFPDCEASHLFADTLAMEMVLRPASFDVIVTNNLFGDILSDLAAALVGGLGVTPSGNVHPGQISVFEPVHGSAPPLAGKGIANPLGSILSAAMLLQHLGEEAAAGRVERAVAACVKAGETTADLGGKLSTAAAGNAVLVRLERESGGHLGPEGAAAW
jgi:3-isopropylmalate dehydrogenase